jgi:hypothetical protein
MNIETLAIKATKAVTIVGIASYTSGAQKWNGAALTLNKNPIVKITKAKLM